VHYYLRCKVCKKVFAGDSGYYKCPDCGGKLEVRYELPQVKHLPVLMEWGTTHPFRVKLRDETQKKVHLCVLDGAEVVYFDKVEGHPSLPVISRIGSRAPAYCTGVGKALLSSLPTDQVVELLRKSPLPKRTPTTITDPVQLLEELKKTRDRGYAIDNGEHEEGIKCFAAPIRGYGGETVGAISITGLKRELDDETEAEWLIAVLKKTAAEISQELGYRSG